jgi:hypothetical protein
VRLPLPHRVAARPAAVRSTLTAVAVALAASGFAVTVFALAVGESFAGGLLDFALFGGLAALTAGVLAWELAGSRLCPRCGAEGGRGALLCRTCGYDLRARPRYACSEGHVVSFEPGMCDCGRRLLKLRPDPILRHAVNSIMFGVVFFVAMVIAALLSGR